MLIINVVTLEPRFSHEVAVLQATGKSLLLSFPFLII